MTALCATCSAPIDRDWRWQTAIVLGREASTCAACTLGTAKRSKRNWRGVVIAVVIAAALAFFLLGCKTEHDPIGVSDREGTSLRFSRGCSRVEPWRGFQVVLSGAPLFTGGVR